ncbi:hypothetical protein HYT00_02535 [Candidatus Giovannonibacteria bacterium]|nr:hypothetical protein [Candidatus Giovannonibacteria bacterium]
MKKISSIILALVLCISAEISFAAEEDEFKAAIEDSNVVAVFVRSTDQLKRFAQYLEKTNQLSQDVPNAEKAYELALWRESRGLEGEAAEKFLQKRIKNSPSGGRVVVVPFLPLKEYVKKSAVSVTPPAVVVTPPAVVQAPAPVVVDQNLVQENRELKQKILADVQERIRLRAEVRKQKAAMSSLSKKVSTAVSKAEKLETKVLELENAKVMAAAELKEVKERVAKLETKTPPSKWNPFNWFSANIPETKNAFSFVLGTIFASSLFLAGIGGYAMGKRKKGTSQLGDKLGFLGPHEIEEGGVKVKFLRRVASQCQCGEEVLHERRHIRNAHVPHTREGPPANKVKTVH